MPVIRSVSIAAPNRSQLQDSVLALRIFKGHADRRVHFLIAGKPVCDHYNGRIARFMGVLHPVSAEDSVHISTSPSKSP